MININVINMSGHLLVEGVEEDYGLDGLAQAHLVGQDGVGALGPGEPQPVQPLQLVHVQRSPRGRHVLRLLLVLDGGLGMGGIRCQVMTKMCKSANTCKTECFRLDTIEIVPLG